MTAQERRTSRTRRSAVLGALACADALDGPHLKVRPVTMHHVSGETARPDLSLTGALGGDRVSEPEVDRAACRGCRTINFFPLESEPSAPAVEVCQRCEVSADCLAYALNNRIVEGIWGGTTEGERRRMLRMRPRKPAA